MEPESRTYNEDLEKTSIRKPSNIMPDVSNVPKSTWIRRTFLYDTESNQFILDYHLTFLPWCSLLFWIIFLIA